MSGRPIPYKELLDAAKHADGFSWLVQGAEHITIRLQPSSSGLWMLWRHDLESNPWWDGAAWQTDNQYLHEMFRWTLDAALVAVQSVLTAERVKAPSSAKRHAERVERARRAREMASVVDELLDPIREAVA